MAHSRGFGAVCKIAGAALLSAGLLVGPLLGTSSAATAAKLGSFSGKGNGYALGVSVDLSGLPASLKSPIQTAYTNIRNNLPSALKASLPAQFNFVVDQKFIETLAQMGATQGAESLLGDGTVNLATALGGASAAKTTTLGTSHQVTKALSLPTASMPLVNVAAGTLDASIASGPKVSSAGTLAQVDASLAAIKAMLPAALAQQLQSALDAVQQQLHSTISTANSSIQTQVTTISNTLTTNPALNNLLNQAGLGNQTTQQVTTTLQNLLKLPDLSNVNLLSGNLASVTKAQNTAGSQKLGTGVVTADATSTLAKIDVLGLLNVNAINLSSHSQAAGTNGSAKNTSSCAIGDVRLGDSNGASLDGKNIYVNGTALPTPAGNLQTIQSALNSVTQAAGLSITLCDATQKDASADGTSAAQRVSALRIEFAPKLPASVAAPFAAGETPIKIVIDPTVETSVAARLAAPVNVAPAEMPHTGAGPLLSVLVGLGLAGTAIFLRRKFA